MIRDESPTAMQCTGGRWLPLRRFTRQCKIEQIATDELGMQSLLAMQYHGPSDHFLPRLFLYFTLLRVISLILTEDYSAFTSLFLYISRSAL